MNKALAAVEQCIPQEKCCLVRQEGQGIEAAGWDAKRWLLSPNSCQMPGCAHRTATAAKGNTAGRDKVWHTVLLLLVRQH